MKNYIGTKSIKGKPMNLGEYNKYRGWDIPKNESPEKEGYLVEYELKGDDKPNHPDHKGYISWSPKAAFDDAYRIADTYMDRLLIEQENLQDKADKLQAALDGEKVPLHERDILNRQLKHMKKYLDVLNYRINK
jgi:DUF1365 family protein